MKRMQESNPSHGEQVGSLSGGLNSSLKFSKGRQEKGVFTSNQGSGEAVDGGEIVVTGNEFGEYKDIKELRKKAVQYYSEHLQGTSVENATLGKIDIDKNGLSALLVRENAK